MRKMVLLTAALATLTWTGMSAWAQTAPIAAPDSMPAASAPAEIPATALRHKTPVRHAPVHISSVSRADVPANGIARPGHEPGVGESFPTSDKASNTGVSATRSEIAPRLPTPPGGMDASTMTFLRDAQNAMNSRQTGMAQEALERAETATLQRSVPANQADQIDASPLVMQIAMARRALGAGDMVAAKQAVTAAMSSTGQ